MRAASGWVTTFPEALATDAILITHPHYDHDGGEFIGRRVPWTPEVRVLRDPGGYTVGDFHITGLRGKHADPWGKEFGQKNTIWRVEVSELRIAHLGDNGPLTESNVQELGRVDILMMPIDAREHILKHSEVQAIRRTRSEEHTFELQSHSDLVCRLLLEKKKKKKNNITERQ